MKQIYFITEESQFMLPRRKEMKKKKPFDLLGMIDLRILPSFAQQVIIASLIEEIRWLKERVIRLERQEDGEMLTSALDPYCQGEEG